MKFEKIARGMSAYLFWGVVMGLGIWLAILGREVFLGFAAKYYVGELYMRQTLVRFLDRSYVIVVGLAWLILMVVTEEIFRKRAASGKLLTSVSAVVGFEIIIIFILDFLLLFLQNWSADFFRIIFLLLELLLGSLLLIYWRRSKRIAV